LLFVQEFWQKAALPISHSITISIRQSRFPRWRVRSLYIHGSPIASGKSCSPRLARMFHQAAFRHGRPVARPSSWSPLSDSSNIRARENRQALLAMSFRLAYSYLHCWPNPEKNIKQGKALAPAFLPSSCRK
jgi:hypothetical protein